MRSKSRGHGQKSLAGGVLQALAALRSLSLKQSRYTGSPRTPATRASLRNARPNCTVPSEEPAPGCPSSAGWAPSQPGLSPPWLRPAPYGEGVCLSGLPGPLLEAACPSGGNAELPSCSVFPYAGSDPHTGSWRWCVILSVVTKKPQNDRGLTHDRFACSLALFI